MSLLKNAPSKLNYEDVSGWGFGAIASAPQTPPLTSNYARACALLPLNRPLLTSNNAWLGISRILNAHPPTFKIMAGTHFYL